MGQSFSQQVLDIPQTGANPNPPAVTYAPHPAGKGGSTITTPATSGQPAMGVPNQYANTIQPGDNMANQSAFQPQGKGSAGTSDPQAHGKGQ